VALEEALLNAYSHGNMEVSSKLREDSYQEFADLAKLRSTESPYKERRIWVSVRFSAAEAVFKVRDDGPGFDISKLPDPTDPLYLERPHGRGLLLMRTFLDDVRYNDRGNEVTLIKRASRIRGNEPPDSPKVDAPPDGT
jgi:anti-sigma regulatory factor (Ser/Thr protein kinase)